MPFFGVYFGLITSSNDPTNSGRVQVEVPSVGSSTWAAVASPFGATAAGGAHVGTRVVVAFERGDPSRPVVLGRVGG